MRDPYLYENSQVLKNKLNTTIRFFRYAAMHQPA